MASELISIDAARQIVLDTVRPLASETVSVHEALGRVLADTVRAAGDVPPFPSSAMDGYAVEPGPAGRILQIAGEARAGAPARNRLRAGEAIRISTGAAVPEGAAAVIRQEDTRVSEGAVELLAEVAAGQNVRHPGEDMRRGATVLEPGVRLGPAELGAAVAAGAGRLACARQPRVAVFCTGDELREPGEPLGPGEIHNSNAPMLAGLARRHGGLPDAVTRLPDTREATEQGLADGVERADVVIISGGVSVGPHDHVKPALATLGVEQRFWGVALQPGKPTWFGTRDERLVFGLPGNPVSAFVTFVLFVAPTLASLQGLRSAPAPRRVSLAAPVRRNRRREQAIRVVLEPQDGRLAARPNGPQGSHIVTSLVGADGLALIAAGEGEVEAGTEVPFLPL